MSSKSKSRPSPTFSSILKLICISKSLSKYIISLFLEDRVGFPRFVSETALGLNKIGNFIGMMRQWIHILWWFCDFFGRWLGELSVVGSLFLFFACVGGVMHLRNPTSPSKWAHFHVSYSIPTLNNMDDQRTTLICRGVTFSSNLASESQWMQPMLVRRTHSLVAFTNRWGWIINSTYICSLAFLSAYIHTYIPSISKHLSDWLGWIP